MQGAAMRAGQKIKKSTENGKVKGRDVSCAGHNESLWKIDLETSGFTITNASLRTLEDLETSILSAIPHAVVGLRNRKIFFANQAIEKVFGWKPAELIGQSTRVLYRNDEEYEEIGRHFYPLLENQQIHGEEFSCRRKDGRDIICKVHAAVIGKRLEKKGVVAVYEDITEHKKTEQALQESEKKYIDLYQNAPDGYHSLDPHGTILEVNDTWLRMFGYKRNEIVGKKNLMDILTNDGRQIFRKTFPELREKGFLENIEYAVKRKDGIMLPIVINATAIYDEKGRFLRSRSIVRDNSEKKKYEMRLMHAAEEWRMTFDSMPYGVLLLDRDFRIIRVNKYVSAIYGISITEVKGKAYDEIIYAHGSGEGSPALNLEAACLTAREYYDKKLNKHFICHVTPIPDETGVTQHFILSLADISDMKDKENKLIESKNAFFNMLKELDMSYKELKEIYDGMIHSFVNAIDAKSPWTKGHSERVTAYSVAIARELGIKEKDIDTLRMAALLHDVGKIGTYDVILDKPGELTDEEFALIRMHPVRGEEILKPIKQLRTLIPIVRHHHERLDGSGYPDGLKNDEIPLFSKIICVADSFDAMTDNRPYRVSPSRTFAISELTRCKGTQFDPEVVEAFLRLLSRRGNVAGIG
jgi:PAS domain S-box-containing protein/putative nucleotidyltransferase with HDIG domain